MKYYFPMDAFSPTLNPLGVEAPKKSIPKDPTPEVAPLLALTPGSAPE